MLELLIVNHHHTGVLIPEGSMRRGLCTPALGWLCP